MYRESQLFPLSALLIPNPKPTSAPGVISQGSVRPGDRKCLNHDSDSDESPRSTVSHDNILMTGNDEPYLSKMIDYVVCSLFVFYSDMSKAIVIIKRYNRKSMQSIEWCHFQ